MSTAIISTLVGLFCTTISSVVTFLLTRRKYNEEVSSQQIENMNNAFDMYKKTVEETLEMQNSKMKMQDDMLKQLQQENSELRKQVHDLQVQMVHVINVANYDLASQQNDKFAYAPAQLKKEVKQK